VRRWIKARQLPALYLGSTKVGYRIRRADLDAFIARRLGQAAPRPPAARPADG
jgi:hypothetical protein